jgi:hypothetical protein
MVKSTETHLIAKTATDIKVICGYDSVAWLYGEIFEHII